PSNENYVCNDSLSWTQAFTNWYESAGHATYSDACSAVTLHPSITLDSAITYLTGALDTSCLQGVNVTISFSLSDDCGNVSTITPSATFSLQDTMPPGFTSLASDLLADCAMDAQTQLQNWLDTLGGASAIDGCGDVSWSFTWVDTSGTTQTGLPNTGPYPQVSGLNCNAAVEITFIVTDFCQNSATDVASFTIIDTIGPVITLETDTIFLSCSDVVPFNPPPVIDLCDANPIIVFQDSVSTDSCLGRPNTIFRTWIATDACGNSTTAQVWILSADTIPPTFDLPSDTVTFCSIDTLVLLNVRDNCDPSPSVTYNDVINGQACNQSLVRTWIVSDACGNVATAIQSFDLSDHTPPVIDHSPGHFVFACDTSFNS
ncbi:MAG TPA: hypothetical protein VJ508_11235, partial [Saprospiraceae bacterium]|nr:hypothetical protein [Saprospiraceae bacterium]